MKVFTAIARWFSRSGVVEKMESSLSLKHQMAMLDIERLFKGQSCLIKSGQNDHADEQNALLSEHTVNLNKRISFMDEKQTARDQSFSRQFNADMSAFQEVLTERHAETLALIKPLHQLLALVPQLEGMADQIDNMAVANSTMSKKMDVLMERPFFTLRELKGAITSVFEEQKSKGGMTASVSVFGASSTDKKRTTAEKIKSAMNPGSRFDLSPKSVDGYIKEREVATGKPFHVSRTKFAALVSRMAKEQGVTLRYFREPVWRNLITAYPLSILAAANNKLLRESMEKK